MLEGMDLQKSCGQAPSPGDRGCLPLGGRACPPHWGSWAWSHGGAAPQGRQEGAAKGFGSTAAAWQGEEWEEMPP